MSEDLPAWYKKKLKEAEESGFWDTEFAKSVRKAVDKVFDEAKKDKEE
jgi:hypothetical protein